MSLHTSRIFFHGQRCLSISIPPTPARTLPAVRRIFSPASIPRCLSIAPTKALRRHVHNNAVPLPPPTKTLEELMSGPYLVHRTASDQLPVYSSRKSGGNNAMVVIKKISGDQRKLADELAESLGLGKDDIRVNPTTQNVELKVCHLPVSTNAHCVSKIRS
ncbi:hypothetical protein E4U42_002471 [Claviceps africana]|uniref:Large ribosomal subunit protein mL49 n=1 Tax=Claviceps africana TaxID=83212 RepID=A0A8K0JEV5_9HYPO|nr:hypothetical protein E4U42_002471 [Claviceps africana]